MKSYFIAHGAPDIVLEKSKYTKILKEIGEKNKDARGVIIFSAHYESHTQKIGAGKKYNTIYDFYGFQKELHEIQTDYFSEETVAERVKKILGEAGIDSVLDFKRGIDHGSWSVLKIIFQELKVPVIQMSVDIGLEPEKQYLIGTVLEKLKTENFLIIGSGGIVHNLGMVDFDAEKPEEWAEDFQNWIKENVLAWNKRAILNYAKEAPYAELGVPRAEHFIPFLIAMGTGDKSRKPRYLAQEIRYGNLGLDIIEFGEI